MKLPEGILAQHIAVLGKTGSGKSSAMRWLVEGLLDDKKPVCIIDPKGDWYGLRISANGKGDGYPVVIFGGAHADVPINERAGASVAELVATGNRPCIIDLGGWMPGERTRFMIDFASTLFRTTKGSRYLVIDECHNFAPQGKVLDPDAGKMLHWFNRLASEGRGHGINLIFASQRPQKVHKDFLTCAETLICMRLIHTLDRNAAKEWIDGAGDVEKGKLVLNTLASMKRGEAWVWSPEIGFGPQRVDFPMFKTYDSFRPQSVDAGTLKGWANIDLEEVKSKLAAVIEEKKASDPAELKKQIATLQKQIRETPAPLEAPAKENRVEIPVLKDSQITRLEKVAEKFLGINGTAKEIGTEISAALRVFNARLVAPHPAVAPRMTVPPRPEVRMSSEPSGETSLGKCERSILIAIKQRHPRTTSKTQAAILSGYSVSSGGFNNSLGKLRSLGLVQGRGDAIAITDAGMEMAVLVPPLPTGAELVEYWKRVLPKAEQKILGYLASVYPQAAQKEGLGEATGYSHTSGGFNNALGKLRTLELINRGPEIRASADLFEE